MEPETNPTRKRPPQRLKWGLAHQLADIIASRSLTPYRLALEAKALGLKLDAGKLHGWLNQDRDLRLSTVEVLCAVLGVRFVETAARTRKATAPQRPGRPRRAAPRPEPPEVPT